MISDEIKGVMPLPQRRTTLTELLNSKNGASLGTYPLRFQEQMRHFNIYRVPIELPVYRLNNGRTLSRQEEYVKKNNKEVDFFIKDTESEEAQYAQHEILKSLVNEAGLLDYFKTHDQQKPLVINKDGFVINGNRRLCAYRMLLADDATRFKDFQYVWVIILPCGDDKDFDKIEAQEQIPPEIRAKYSWVDEAMLFKYRKKTNNWSPTELANFYEKDEKDVTELIDMLDHAERYLNLRGWDKEYSRVEKAEFAFKQLRKFRKKYDDEESCEIFTKACYTIVDNPEMQKDRAYKIVSDVYENLDNIKPELKELASESIFQLDKNSSNIIHDDKGSVKIDTITKTDNPSKNKLSLLGDNTENESKDVVKFISDPKNSKIVYTRMREVIDRQKQLKKESDNASYSLNKVKDAHTFLQAALTSINSESNIKGMDKQLENIESLVVKIRKKVSEHAKN